METEIREFLKALPDDAKVCEVGGGSSRQPRADYVIDIVPWSDITLGPNDRVSKDRYIVTDICHGRWPVEDNAYDFTICSHTLEDVMNPFHVIRELMRVSPAGYIEVPDRAYESARSPFGAVPGATHHRWLIERDEDNALIFRPKDGLLTNCQALQLRGRALILEHLICIFWDRKNPIKYREEFFSEEDAIKYRSRVESISVATVRRDLARERFAKRVYYKALRTIGAR